MVMVTERQSKPLVPILLAATLLLWPAFWNGYPLVFSDTGTYLSQAINHYIGWDRPVFYSFFLLPLHLTVTTWPAIAAQALLVVYILHLVHRTLRPDSSAWWLLPITTILATTTSLPWFAAQLMPDVFTGLLVLAMTLLIFAPERLSRGERIFLIAFASFMIAAHGSHIVLALALLLTLPLLRRWFLNASPLGVRGAARAATPLLLAIMALLSVHLIAFGRASLSPFGNVFLLARVIYDGPGMDVLRRDCPTTGWQLCPFVDRMPATSDEFLWRADGPVVLAGGAKRVSSEASTIIRAALRTEPVTELRAVVKNAAIQLGSFASGDGLQAWPITVAPWIQKDFPRFEFASYLASRQSQNALAVPPWLRALHRVTALASAAGLLVALFKRNLYGAFAAAVLLALLVNASVLGGLSSPHDRYESRLIWLPAFVLLMAMIPTAHQGTKRTLGTRVRWGNFAVPNLGSGTLTNVAWAASEAAISALLLSFASAFIVARLIGPAEVGIGAAVVAVHVLLWVAVNSLFADALVQRITMDRVTFSSAFIASITIGCAAMLLQAASGPPLNWLLSDPRLPTMSFLLAVPLPLVGAAGPVQGLLTRDRAYKALAFRTVIGQGLGTLVGIVAAIDGGGAWALVLQQFVISAVGALALLHRCPVRPVMTANWNRLTELLRIGLPLTASTLIYHGRYRLFALLVGGTAGATTLGEVHMAFRLIDTVRELAFTAQWRLMLPFLSERQNDIPALRVATDRCLAWSSLLAFPLCAALAVSIQPLVALLLGPVWAPSGTASLPLIALAVWLFLAFPAGVAVVARGEPRYTLIANIAGTAATALGVLFLRPDAPLDAVLVWLGAQLFVSPYILWTNARVLKTSPLRPLRAGLATAAASALATGAAFALPKLIGEPTSPSSLLVLRLAVVVLITVPSAFRLARHIDWTRTPTQWQNAGTVPEREA